MIGGYDKISTDIPRLSCTSELGSSSEGGTPPPRDVTTPPSSDLATPLSPHTNENSGSVFDNGEVWGGGEGRGCCDNVPLFM